LADFLTSRGSELRPGGKLAVLRWRSATTAISDIERRTLYEALLDLVGYGVISSEEMGRMAIPTFARSHADFMAPFRGIRASPASRLSISISSKGRTASGKTFSAIVAHRFGARWAAFSRASVFPTLAEALDGGLDAPRARTFVDKLEATNAARLAEKPEPMVIPLASRDYRLT
jgi:hypothetical protein